MLKILNKYGCANSTAINSKKSVEVFDKFRTMYSKDLIPKETVTMTLQEALEKYMSENILRQYKIIFRKKYIHILKNIISQKKNYRQKRLYTGHKSICKQYIKLSNLVHTMKNLFYGKLKQSLPKNKLNI